MLSEQNIRESEPGLSNVYRWGIELKESGFCSNPFKLVIRLSDHFLKNEGKFLHDSVKKNSLLNNGSIQLSTNDKRFTTNKLIIVAGAWSHKLTEHLGVKIPLETEHGYHVTIKASSEGPKHYVTESLHKFITTPMEMGVHFCWHSRIRRIKSSYQQ